MSSRTRNWWIACTVAATVIAAVVLHSLWAIPCGLVGGFFAMARWYKPWKYWDQAPRPPFWKR
jgi:hypothetical protein